MTNHVVFDAAAQTMRCHHCGAAEALPLPAPILEACNRMDAFNDAHKDCLPTGVDSDGGSHD